jgi:Na+/proline symporter
MLKNWTHDITLAIQAKSGASLALLAWVVVVVAAALTAFVFLCVALYDWLAQQFNGVIAGLLTAGVFIAIAVIGAIAATLTCRRTRERAILARAAKAHASSWLLDPKIVGGALQAAQTLGWQRIVPVVLVVFMAAQWVRRPRQQSDKAAD